MQQIPEAAWLSLHRPEDSCWHTKTAPDAFQAHPDLSGTVRIKVCAPHHPRLKLPPKIWLLHHRTDPHTAKKTPASRFLPSPFAPFSRSADHQNRLSGSHPRKAGQTDFLSRHGLKVLRKWSAAFCREGSSEKIPPDDPVPLPSIRV